MIRSKSSLHKRRIAKIAQNQNSKDEIVEKERQCEFIFCFSGSISFYEYAHTVQYEFKHFRTVKMSFVPLCIGKAKQKSLYISLNALFNHVNYSG